MSLTDKSPFQVMRRNRRWGASFIALALAAWLIGFATHRHADDDRANGGHSAVHLCTVCAALSAGVNSDAVALPAPPSSTPDTERATQSGPPRIRSYRPYLSRAPPLI